ncbi:hypothetical protein QFZ26_000937 [Agromyces ramosus]|uniref:Uncharacterized protein n=1 Tax=Agromyces ramosus TaxID=33879 RepID=A0ABU0R6K8_9MICO|nr:hypothetical protein [Agromyces ramosus]
MRCSLSGLDDAAVTGEVLVERMQRLGPRPVGDLEHRAEPVRLDLVGSEEAEVVGILANHLGEPGAEHPGGLAARAARRGRDLERERLGRRQREGAHDAAVRMRAGAHAQLAARAQRIELGDGAPVVVEELLGPVRTQPRLEQREVLGVLAHAGERHLVRVERPLDLHAVDDARARPPLRGAQHDGGPPRCRGCEGAGCGIRPDVGEAIERHVDRVGHARVHRRRLLAVEAAGDEQRLVAIAAEELDEFSLGDAGEEGGVRDLVAVEVQDRQHGPVVDRVQERMPAPAPREWTGLGLAVADDARDDEPGVVERRAEGVHERVAELAALVDRSRRLGGRMRRDAARERELPHEALEARRVGGDRGEQLGVRAVEPRVRDHRGAAMPGAAHVDDRRAALDDGPVEVRVDEVQPGGRAPVAE